MPRAHALVVGCGNDLRSDDRAGRAVARRIEALGLAGVTVRSVTQLVPELAVDVANVDHVVIVDASVDVDELTVSELDVDEHEPPPGSTTHHVTPASLVHLARMLGGAPPTSMTIVAVPAHDMGFGELMSASTSTAVDGGVSLLADLLASPEPPASPTETAAGGQPKPFASRSAPTPSTALPIVSRHNSVE